MNKKIINIDDMPMDLCTNLYNIPGNYLNLCLPFSYYFMKQLISIKKLYNEELDHFYEQPEIMVGKMEEFLENFSENIPETIPALTPTILQLFKNLYFEDL
ncbi:e3 ubiquitin-protein ligase [Gigaspora margarita]|uniref:E3 ubiquitin-protein ligase n=1 Tax=Gigaspora margarita TaxID=4874 RepID=A0A8H4B4W6_GIGMA|nr:e3 ubiquitin-protein ligase [Gigaspora margarita]